MGSPTNAATSSLLMARNMLKSAVPTLSAASSLPGPRAQLCTGVLTQAREVYGLSPISTTENYDTPPGIEFLQSLFRSSLSLVNYGVEKLQALLTQAGEMGKKLLDLIESHPTRAALVSAGVLLVVATGAAYKFILIKGKSQNLLQMTPPVAPENPAPLEWEELELMRCPITLTPLIDPVLAADGHTYERNAIELWFQSGQRISPMTGEPLPNLNLIPNYIVRQTQEQLLGGR
uniref:U-box domain-containing protein n=1 Tax=Paramoeba aestuarina TaxID=180227 RepID=A0A7S4URN4_9EUKA